MRCIVRKSSRKRMSDIVGTTPPIITEPVAQHTHTVEHSLELPIVEVKVADQEIQEVEQEVEQTPETTTEPAPTILTAEQNALIADPDEYFRTNPIQEEHLSHFNDAVRLAAYTKIGFSVRALHDSFWCIRLDAYRKLGFTDRAFLDADWRIRLEAYTTVGFTTAALQDKQPEIQEAAKAYFSVT